MNSVFTLAPREDWICDRLVAEWNVDNGDVSVTNPENADVIWLYADWAWTQIPQRTLYWKKVICTVHHVVPEKFGPRERMDFEFRDRFVTAYHVPNGHTESFIKPLTTKPIHVIPYWANQHTWRPVGTQAELRIKHKLPTAPTYLIGSFQRDTEGSDLVSPKLEKGPDLLAEAIIAYRDRCAHLFPVHVVLAGWRRQYIMGRLEAAQVPYSYFEKPPQQIVNELYQTLQLYPVTSRVEGGPQSLIECGLLNVPVVSRDVGIASQVLPSSAINDDVTKAIPCVPNITGLTLPAGYQPFRRLIESL
jgi:glycosyltransferase involved in cell wall biosynthesis